MPVSDSGIVEYRRKTNGQRDVEKLVDRYMLSGVDSGGADARVITSGRRDVTAIHALSDTNQ